jgi:hypothetical protein
VPGPDATPSAILFPAGPTYAELLDSDHRPGWVRYKVWSADWYTGALEQLASHFGDYQGYVGLEMAIDGALSALSGAFDAAVALLITSTEQARGVADKDRLPAHKYGWSSFTRLAQKQEPEGPAPGIRDFPGVADLMRGVDEALLGQFDDTPIGWLAILRRLRNLPMHQSSLPRTWTVDWETNETIDVTLTGIPGDDPVAYLKDSCDRMSLLTERMISAANLVGYVGANTPLSREPWGS